MACVVLDDVCRVVLHTVGLYGDMKVEIPKNVERPSRGARALA